MVLKKKPWTPELQSLKVRGVSTLDGPFDTVIYSVATENEG